MNIRIIKSKSDAGCRSLLYKQIKRLTIRQNIYVYFFARHKSITRGIFIVYIKAYTKLSHINNLDYIMPNSKSLFFSLILATLPYLSYAQCTAGAITKAHSSSTYDLMLDPDSDGYITETGSAFPNGTTEMSEFEILPNSITGWVEIQDVSETDSDITPNCGNSDLIQDDDGGDFAFYNIIDPTPLVPSGGDEYIIFRFRLAKSPNGNFGYNFLVDNDAAYGSGTDINSICGNRGFEREVQFANAGGKKGVSVYDVDGNDDHKLYFVWSMYRDCGCPGSLRCFFGKLRYFRSSVYNLPITTFSYWGTIQCIYYGFIYSRGNGKLRKCNKCIGRWQCYGFWSA